MAEASTQSTPKKAAKARPPADWQERFLSRLRDNGNVSDACLYARIDRKTAYNWREKSKTFAAQWEEALDMAVEELERTANARARYNSDTLLIFLLKAHRPEKYRETVRNEHTGANGAPLFTEVIVNLPRASDEPVAD
jgi:hypothetical protein